jgi:hypothetical protein
MPCHGDKDAVIMIPVKNTSWRQSRTAQCPQIPDHNTRLKTQVVWFCWLLYDKLAKKVEISDFDSSDHEDYHILVCDALQPSTW